MATSLISKVNEANPEIMGKLFFQREQPANNTQLFAEAVTSIDLMKTIVDVALAEVKKISDEDVKGVRAYLKLNITGNKPAERESIAGKINFLFLNEVFIPLMGLAEDAEFVKNASSSSVQKECLRLVSDSRIKEIMRGYQVELANSLNNIQNPEGRKLAETLLKKLKPQPSFKERFKKACKKAWAAITTFFQRLFSCCCKKSKGQMRMS